MSVKKAKTSPAILLTQKLIELSESTWVETTAFQTFVDFMQVKPGEAKVDFVQRLLALIKRIPPKLLEPETRAKILEAGQEYLDKSIDEEETLLEQEDASAREKEKKSLPKNGNHEKDAL